VPKLVNKVILGEYVIDDFITHNFDSLEEVNKSIEALRSGVCLRAVIKISNPPSAEVQKIRVTDSIKYFGGRLKTVKHWSSVCNSEMTFNIYLPDEPIKDQRGEPYPVLYMLAGLSGNYENFPTKGSFGPHASKHRIACVFPDTSPRNTGIEGVKDVWSFGEGGGFYLDATEEKYSKYFKMYTYITKELPEVVNRHFHVDPIRQSILGYSMGGMGAFIAYLRNPNQYLSLSVFAPLCHAARSS
jgi:S-formylglutathione hydrolase